ncbi:MAG TPA: hypothetical protein VFZ97_12225 [Acidimicrobiales bacterium]
MPWWGWVLTASGATFVIALTFRKQLLYLVRVAKACATDDRLPRPLRWVLGVALVIKAVPVPDFGIDEVLLIVVGILLVTLYRPTFRAILEESRREPPPSE